MLELIEIAPQRIRPLRRAEYDRLVSSGAFDDEPVELIRGQLVTMAPNDPEHADPIDILNATFIRAVGDRARVRVQQPIVAIDESEPEPDLAVVPLGSYSKEHPASAHLVVEVAISSLKKDRNVKAPLYAASGFEEYWLVNVTARTVEVFRNPADGKYQDVAEYGSGSTLRALAFPELEVAVDTLFQR